MENTAQPLAHYNFIAIEGNIGAGKTTLCHQMADRFGCALVLEQFTDNPFLPPFYEQPERYAFPVELFFMTERHKQLQRSLLNQDLFREFTVADYAFIKTLLFARKNLPEDEFRLFHKMFTVLNQSFPKPDIMVYFHRNVDILLENISQRGSELTGVTSGFKALDKLTNGWQRNRPYCSIP